MVDTTLTAEEYTALRARYDAYEQARARICASPTCVTPDEARLLPPALSNDERSALEVYEFCRDLPADYFCYVDTASNRVTTWPGQTLGRIVAWGQPFTSNMGDKRRYLRVAAINGLTYGGYYYCSSGDYARLKMLKS